LAGGSADNTSGHPFAGVRCIYSSCWEIIAPAAGAGDGMSKLIRLLALVLALGVTVAADAGQAAGSIAGTVRDAQGQPLASAKLQLRNIDTGLVVATTRAGADAAYQFSGIVPGNYVVEIVDDSGKVIGLSVASSMAANGAITGLIVALSSTGAAAAAAAGGLGAFFASTGGILLLVGIGAGVTAGVIAATNSASPSR
jgi:Carboxypeptidase regulatory-like domain